MNIEKKKSSKKSGNTNAYKYNETKYYTLDSRLPRVTCPKMENKKIFANRLNEVLDFIRHIEYPEHKALGYDSYWHYYLRECSVKKTLMYGYTVYNGDMNRNKRKSVSFILYDGTEVGRVERDKWIRYEREVGRDDVFWMSVSDNRGSRWGGITIRVFVEKPTLVAIKDLLEENDKHWNEVRYKQVLLRYLNDIEPNYAPLLSSDVTDSNRLPSSLNWTSFPVVGMRFYVSSPFVCLGYCEPEPNNPHNQNAVAVYTSYGLKVGHIPDTDLSDYRLKCNGQIPVVIDVWKRSNGNLSGEVTTFTNDFHGRKVMYDYFKSCVEQTKYLESL